MQTYEIHDNEVRVFTACRDTRNLPANVYRTDVSADEFKEAIRAYVVEGICQHKHLAFEHRDEGKHIAITNTASTAIGALIIPTEQAPRLLLNA